MRKRIHFLLAVIGVLLVVICPVYAEMLPDETIQDTTQNESEIAAIDTEIPSSFTESEIDQTEETITAATETEAASETDSEMDDTQPILKQLSIKNKDHDSIGTISFDDSSASFGTSWFYSEIWLYPEADGTVSINGNEIPAGECYGPVELPVEYDDALTGNSHWRAVDTTTTITVTKNNQTKIYTLTAYRYIPVTINFSIYRLNRNDPTYSDILYDSFETGESYVFYYPDPEETIALTADWLSSYIGDGFEYTDDQAGSHLPCPIIETEYHRLSGNDFYINVQMVHHQKPEDFSVKLYYTVNGKRLDETGQYTFKRTGPVTIDELSAPDVYTYDLEALGLGAWEDGVHYRSLFSLIFNKEKDTWQPSVDYCEVPVIKDNAKEPSADDRKDDSKKANTASDSKTNTQSGTVSKSAKAPETADTFPMLPVLFLLMISAAIICQSFKKDPAK